MSEREICPGCKAEIDPTCCGCGGSMDHSPWEGHSPVPMGCNCLREPVVEEFSEVLLALGHRERPEGRPPNCDSCGRFCYWRSDVGVFQCTQASYDSHAGQWEHN